MLLNVDDFIVEMGRFDKYNIDLKGLKSAILELEFALDNAFFADIDGEEFQKGTVKAFVTVKIDSTMCNGCGLCKHYCKFNAIEKVGR